jgi:hypothetical protein
VLEVPPTVAVNVALWFVASVATVGERLTLTGSKVTVAFAVLDESAALVAVIVTVCWAAMNEGA